MSDHVTADKVFKMVGINADINTAGFFTINTDFDDLDPATYIPVFLWDDTPFEDLPAFTLGDPSDTINWNPGMDPSVRSSVTQLTNFSMGFKKDSIYRGEGGILPTNTGDLKSNVPGQYGEWRNGALTVQVVEIDPMDLSSDCTFEPTWSNASISGVPGSRSPQGPVSNCATGNGVLFEGTLFWHWGDGEQEKCANIGSPSYHEADWPEEYDAYFATDCFTGPPANDPDSTCNATKLCHVLVDGEAVQLEQDSFYILLDVQKAHRDVHVQGLVSLDPEGTAKGDLERV